MSSEASWPEVPLGQAVREVRTGPFGSMLHEEDYVRGGIPIVNPINILGAGVVPDPEKTILIDKARELEGFLLEADDVVVARRGEMGRCARVTSDQAGWLCGTGCFVVRPGQKMDGGFLAYLLGSATVKSALESLASGVTMLNLGNRALQSLIVPMPPIDEQRRIAEVLRSVDEAIAANTLALNQARLLQSCIAEDFLAKHSHDEQVMLRDVVVETGSGWSPGCDPEAARPEEWGILKTSAITWDGYDDSECKRLPDNLEPKPDLAVRANDILITRAGQAYRTGVVAFVFSTSGTRMLSDKMIRIRADEAKILPLVLCQVLKGSSVQGQLNPLKSGLTTLTNITQKMIGDVTFPLPAMADQRLFMQAIESVDEQIGYLVREANYLGGLKAALSADLLPGRVRVPA